MSVFWLESLIHLQAKSLLIRLYLLLASVTRFCVPYCVCAPRFRRCSTLVSLADYFTVKYLNSSLISFCICPTTTFFVVTKGIAFTILKLDTLLWTYSILTSIMCRLGSFSAPSTSLSTMDVIQWHLYTPHDPNHKRILLNAFVS